MKKVIYIVTGAIIFVLSSFYGKENALTAVQSRSGTMVKPVQVRILCYNIHHCNPPSKPDFIDIQAVADVINKEKPDLVALQEVDVNTGRSGNVDQARELAEKTGMNVYFAKAIDFDGGQYGVAILSKFDILESNNYPLPSKPSTNGEPRVLGTIKVKTPEGIELIFGSTHLDSQKEDTNRLLQIKEIGRIVDNARLPVIVAGDFNDTPGSKTIDILDRHLQRTCKNCQPTIPVKNPVRAIDFITYRPDDQFKVISQKVVQETYASDHLPVLSVLEIVEKY